MLSSLSSRIAVLGIIVIMAIVMLVVSLLDASTQTREGFRWVSHSSEVIEAMDETLVELREAESGQRGYVLTGKPGFVQSFEQRIAGARKSMIKVVAMTVDNPPQHARAKALQEAVDQRIVIMQKPLKMARDGDFGKAREFISSGPGQDVMAKVMLWNQVFLEEEHALQDTRLKSAEDRLAQVKRLALVGGPAICLLVIVMGWLISRDIRRPAAIIRAAMTSLGQGDQDARVTEDMRSREFAGLADGYNAMAKKLELAVKEQGRSELELKVVNEELFRQSDVLRDRGEVIELLGGMAHRMQASRTDEELAQVIRVFVPRVLPGIAGALYAHNNSRNLLLPITGWNGLHPRNEGFAPDACWALRRGQSHFVSGPGSDIVCSHVGDDHLPYHCEPLLAGGEVIGTLHFEGTIEPENRFRLAVLAENIASALVNHRLQRGLREQTIRDPLTALFNRRYMEETLAIEIARSTRSGAPLSLIMCDVDHFKRFNDEFGHDAGDAVLQAVAAEMRNGFDNGEVVCRYGGEEFTIIAPGVTAEALLDRVEHVRQAITEINLRQAGRTLGSTSMSFGIATWNNNMDREGLALIQSADGALYRAKREGRNRAIIDQRYRPGASAAKLTTSVQ
jgi:diguanylate cyclase (GGDEF)-like protein